MSLNGEKKLSFTSVHQYWKALESVNRFSVRCLVPNSLWDSSMSNRERSVGKKSQSKSSFQLAQIQKCEACLSQSMSTRYFSCSAKEGGEAWEKTASS